MLYRIKHEYALTWRHIFTPSWSLFVYLFSVILSLTLALLLSYEVQFSKIIQSAYIQHVLRTSDTQDESGHTQSKQVTVPEWLIPEPLPFPKLKPLENGTVTQFKIPEAEFTISIEQPNDWSKIILAGDTVRFQPQDQMNQHSTFSAGCFGDCDRLEQNIANSLSMHVEQDHDRGLDPRVMHWYVHHKAWVEYSLLYRKDDGSAWLSGSSLRWSEEWLNVIKCTYRAPINFPYENEEVLHLAWDIWAPEFIRYCRNYKVISWD